MRGGLQGPSSHTARHRVGRKERYKERKGKKPKGKNVVKEKWDSLS